MAQLDSTKPRDNVLVEWQCALELRASGSLEAILPLLIGGPGPAAVAPFPWAVLGACPDTVHTATAEEVRAQLGGAAPPAEALGSGSVRDIVGRISDSLGHEVQSWDAAAAFLEAQLRAMFSL